MTPPRECKEGPLGVIQFMQNGPATDHCAASSPTGKARAPSELADCFFLEHTRGHSKKVSNWFEVDGSCMSPPLSPSPILSPNTPATQLPTSFRFRFDVGASPGFEPSTFDAVPDGLRDDFLTMDARVKSPVAASDKLQVGFQHLGGRGQLPSKSLPGVSDGFRTESAPGEPPVETLPMVFDGFRTESARGESSGGDVSMLEDGFETMGSRVKSPTAFHSTSGARVTNPGEAVRPGEENVERETAEQYVIRNLAAKSLSPQRSFEGLPSREENFPRNHPGFAETTSNPELYRTGVAQKVDSHLEVGAKIPTSNPSGPEVSEPSSTPKSSNSEEGLQRAEKEIGVDERSVKVTHGSEGSVVDLDIEKLAMEIETHNRAASNAVMERFLAVKRKLVKHEQEAVERANLQHQKEVTRLNAEMARLRDEHKAATARARAMVDMANRAAELVALRSRQSRDTALLCSVLWVWKEETNWQRYLKRMERKAHQQYEQHSLQRKPLRKWRELSKTAKLHMAEFKTKMFLQEEKERLAAESAGEVQRLQLEASELREDLAGEKKAREKLEEDMKRAFMRGVCALNIEALSMMKRGGLAAVQDGFDSPNTVVTGPPAIKEHAQYYEDVVEEACPPTNAPSAAGFYRSTSPGLVRATGATSPPTENWSTSRSEHESPSKLQVERQADDRNGTQTDGTAPEERTISEQLKKKLAAVMADGRTGTFNGPVTRAAVRPPHDVTSGTVVDVRSQTGGAAGPSIWRPSSQIRRSSDVQQRKEGVGIARPAFPRWN